MGEAAKVAYHYDNRDLDDEMSTTVLGAGGIQTISLYHIIYNIIYSMKYKFYLSIDIWMMIYCYFILG